MSNEELVKLIQKGERELLSELWEGVRGYIAKTARSYMVCYDGRYGVELDDLIQSGFIAMVNAAESYTPGDAKFLTWFTYHLKTAFAEAANRRTLGQKQNPLHSASSLYEPVDEEGDLLLIDTIPGDDAFEEVEAKIYRQQLRADLEAILSTIPAQNADVLRQHFFEAKELTEIAKSEGVSTETISARKRRGLQNIRCKIRTEQGAKLRSYIEERTNYYSGMGYMAFLYSQTSPIEQTVLKRQRFENDFVNAQYQQQLYQPRKHSGVIRARK